MHAQLHPGLLVLTALLGCGEPGGSTSSASGTSTTQSSTSSASSSTGSAATTDSGGTGTQGPTTATSEPTSTATTATSSGSTTGGSGSTDGSTGTTVDTTGGTTNESGTTTTASTTTGGTTTGGTTTESSTTGGVCQQDMESCANGETCCRGLLCCEGVPIPPGQEFCAPDCPDSDRNLKTDIRPIDVDDILARVVELDITTWRYKKDGADVRHLGPMAQDFRAAFGLWNTDTMIFPLDATGVSMAAVQGLYRRLQAAEAENGELRVRLEDLERRLAALGTDRQP